MFIDLKRNFKKLFKGMHVRASLNMREVFKGSGFANLPPCMFDQYPVPIPPNMTIEAYVVRFLVSEKSLTQLFQICQHAGYVVNPKLSTQVMMKNAQHLPAQKMMLFLYPAFGGVIVSFACNDLDVLAAVQRSALEPPLPAESFPWFEPENVGSLQGDVEYWWDYLWLPFWVSLSLQERTYLALNPEWREFMESHHIPDDPVVAG
ncbi:hypothetical protein ACWIJ6_13700 [Aeromonas piscicola]